MKNYKSTLHRRPHYEEMSREIIQNPPKIKYPNRRATIMRNSHYLSRFDGDSSFINLEEQENNIAKEQLLQQEIKRISRENKETHTGLIADASSPKVTAEITSGYNTANEDVMDIEDTQNKRQTTSLLKRFKTSQQQRLNLQDVSKEATSSMEQFHSPREVSDFTSDPKAQGILEKVRNRFPDPGRVVTIASGVAGAIADEFGPSALIRDIRGAPNNIATLSSNLKDALVNVGIASKDVAKQLVREYGPTALTVGSHLGSGALTVGSHLGSGALNVARTGADNFVHNMKVTGEDIKFFMNSEKPNFEAIKKAILAGIKVFQEAGQPLTQPRFSALTSPEYTYLPGSSSSSSSSSNPQVPQSYGPDASPPRAQPSHGTGMEVYESVDEWLKKAKTKGKLYDQLIKRPGYAQFLGGVNAQGYNVDDPELRTKINKMTREQMAEMILILDGKKKQ